MRPGSMIEFRGALGEFVPAASDGPVLLLAAGIGALQLHAADLCVATWCLCSELRCIKVVCLWDTRRVCACHERCAGAVAGHRSRCAQLHYVNLYMASRQPSRNMHRHALQVR